MTLNWHCFDANNCRLHMDLTVSGVCLFQWQSCQILINSLLQPFLGIITFQQRCHVQTYLTETFVFLFGTKSAVLKNHPDYHCLFQTQIYDSCKTPFSEFLCLPHNTRHFVSQAMVSQVRLIRYAEQICCQIEMTNTSCHNRHSVVTITPSVCYIWDM